MRRKTRRWLALLGAAAMLMTAACQTVPSSDSGTNRQTASAGEPVLSDTETDGMDFGFSNFDGNETYDEANASSAVFSDSGVTCRGEGVSAQGCTVTIVQGGTYVLTGTCGDGRVVVDAGEEDKVQLVLDGLTLASSDGPAFYFAAADKVAVTLQGENALSDGASFAFSEDEKADGAIFSRADLVFNGDGSLTVQGNADNGIVSKDDLIFYNGRYTVTAVNDAIQGKDCVKIRAGCFVLDAGGDGIQSSNSEDADKGFVFIEGGEFTVTAGADGIQAATVLNLSGGTVNLVTGGGSQNASTSSGWGSWGGFGGRGGQEPVAASDTSTSAKGLKAGSLLQITGGQFTLDTSDDAVHGNDDVQIDGGTLSLTSGDDGIHADDALLINGGTITVTKSYEGLEGNSITITGGTIDLVASDDGINAAGGADASAFGRPGENAFSGSSSSFLRITGGSVTVNASGDGLDANGDLYIDGGVVLVSGPTDSGNGALDYDGTAAITGGVLAATGNGGMAQNMGSSSTQGCMLYGFSETQKAGSMLTVADSSGAVLLSFTPAKDYTCAVLSCPEMTVGNAYTVSVGGHDVGTFTLSSLVQSSGVFGGGGMGGGMFPGGKR